VLNTFRNVKGQPTNTRKLIGRLDQSGARLIPNDSYFELYGPNASVEFMPEFASVINVVSLFLVSHILSRVGVMPLLVKVLGASRATEVLTAATYMVCEGNVFEHVADWCERSLIGGTPLSPQKASALFASLTHDERMAFFKSWIQAQAGHGCLSYDVTSFSSYAEGIRDLEWGYNRDGDRLPQINLGCYLAQDSRLPLFFVTYPGSIVDKAYMPYMMAYNEELGIGDDVVYVMDRGFCSTANVNYLHSEGFHYVMGVDMRHKATQVAIDKARDSLASMRNLVRDGTYAVAIHARFYGESSTMHIYSNPELGERQKRDLLRLVESQEEELKQLTIVTNKELKRFSRFFDLSVDDGKVSFTRNYYEIDQAAKYCGIFCILSNTQFSSAEVLTVYRRKDTIEKGFDDIKNHIDMKRMRVHSDAAVAGKLF